jgi:hypothetical protein
MVSENFLLGEIIERCMPVALQLLWLSVKRPALDFITLFVGATTFQSTMFM